MSVQNRFGLSRRIPDTVQRTVRQRCKFRCVICGAYPPHDYEHFRPDFADCVTHDPDGITLLCLSCHGRVTRGTWSKSRVTEADRKVGNGVAEYLRLKDIEFRWPAWLILGRTVVLGEGLLLVVGNDECLRLDRDCDGFPELSVTLRSRRGRAVFQLHRNALVDIHPEFDFEQRGNEATLRSSNGNIILNIAYYPPELIQIRRVKLMGCGIDPIDIDSRNAFPVVRERIVGGDLAALSGPIVLMGKDRMQIRNGSLISPMIDQNVFDHLIEEGAIEDLLKKRFHDEQLVEALAMARRRGQTQ